MKARNSPGEVRDAIIEALSQHGAGASVQQIHQAVAEKVGEAVPASSVRSYLALNTPGLFYRTKRGHYQLSILRDVPVGESESTARAEYSYGTAKLLRTDCFKWLASTSANQFHAVVTDPPYGLVEYTAEEQQKLRAGRGGIWRIPPSYDGHQRAPLPRFSTLSREQLEDLRSFFSRWGRLVMRVIVPGAHVIVASNPLLSHVVGDALAASGLERRGEVIRLVMTMRGGDRPKNAHEEFPDVSVMPRSMWEPWLLFRKPLEGRVQDNLRKWKTGGLRRISSDRPFGDVIQSHPTRKGERSIAPHPSLKPQAFLRQLVRASLPLGEGTVLDPFAGSGSTLAAAHAVGYSSVGLEIDPEYFTTATTAIPKLASLRIKDD